MEGTDSSSSSPGNDVMFSDFLSDTDSESDVFIEEKLIEEVMRELYKEIISPAPETVVEFYGESCGASVSESSSSVMAGVEFAGVVGKNQNVRGEEEMSNDMEVEEEEGRTMMMMNGCDGVEFGDEWLENVMGWSPLRVEKFKLNCTSSRVIN